MSNTIELGLKSTLKGGSEQAFKAFAAGLKLLGKELKSTAKELYKMGKTEVADSVGHISMAVNNTRQELKKLGSTTKETNKDLTKGSEGLSKYTKEVNAVSQAWQLFTKNTNHSNTTLRASEAWVTRFSKSIGNLFTEMRAGGVGKGPALEWAKALDFSKVQTGLKEGSIKLIGQQLHVVREEGYKLLGMNDKMQSVIETNSKYQSIYTQQLNKGKEAGLQYTKAVKELGKEYSKNNEQARIWAPTLGRVQAAMQATSLAAKNTGVNFDKMSKGFNLATLTQQVLQGNLKATTKGFQILNHQGMAAFSTMTQSSASKLGMLSKSFDTLGAKVGAVRMTEFGRAMLQSVGRTEKFRLSIRDLAKTYGVNSQNFKDHYMDMKSSDDLWRKHVTTLQKTGQVSADVAAKMKNGFNAVGTSSKALAEHLAEPKKQYEELRKAVNRVASVTGQSTSALWKEVEAMRAMKKPHDDVVVAINSKIKANAEYQAIAKKIEAQENKLAKLSGSSVEALKQRTTALVNSAKSEKELISISQKRLDHLTRETERIGQAVKGNQRMEAANTRLRSSYHDLVTTNKAFERELRNTVTAYGRSKAEGDKMAAVLKLNAKEARLAAGQMTLFQRAVHSLTSHIKSFASYAAAATFIGGFVGSIGLGIAAIIDFDQALMDLQAITGATDREVNLMGETIKHVAATTKFSAQEVAQGMKLLGQAGFSAQEAIQTIQAVSDLATGTLTDMGTAVDLVTTAMRVFDITANDSARVADVFANAINKSKLTVEKLRVAFNYVGPLAAESGVAFEELAASMMILANSGIRASTIGTGLRQILVGLLKPSVAFKEGIKAAGMTLDDFNPQVRSMEQIIGNLRIVVDSTDKAFRMFGIRGASAVTALTARGTKGYREMLASAERAGSAAEMAALQMEGLGVKLKNMFDRAKNLAIAIGENGLAKALHVLIDAMRGLISAVTIVVDSSLGSFTATVIASTAAIGLFYAAIAGFKGGMLATWLVQAVAGLKAFIAMLGAASLAIGKFIVAGGPILWTFMGIVAVIAAVKTGFDLYTASMVKNYEEARNLADEYKSLSETMTEYQVKVSQMVAGSEEYNRANLALRIRLIEVAKGTSELADKARDLLGAINPVTGEITGSTEALKEFQEEANRLQLQKMGEALNTATDIFDENIEDWKLQLKEYQAMLVESSAKSKQIMSESNARGSDYQLSQVFDEDAKAALRSSKAMQIAIETLRGFKEGTKSLEDVKIALMDIDVASTSFGKEIIENLKNMEIEALDTFIALQKTGKVNLSMTTESIMAMGKEMGLFVELSDSGVKSVQDLVEGMKEASGSESSGIAEGWAEDLKKIGSDYQSFVEGASGASLHSIQAVMNLNKESILDYEAQKKAIAAAAQENLKLYDQGRYEEYYKNQTALNRQAYELNAKYIDNLEVKKYLAARAESERNKEAVAELEASFNMVGEEEYYRRKIELAKKHADKLAQIEANIVDPAELANEFKEYKAREETKLAAKIAMIERYEALEVLTKEEAERQKLQSTLDHHRDVEAEAKRHYDTLASMQDQDPTAMTAAQKRYQEAAAAYFKDQTKALQEVNSKRVDLEARLSDELDKRKKNTKETGDKIVEIETDVADKIKSINEDLHNKLNELQQKRNDAQRKYLDDMVGLNLSTEDKLRALSQRSMTDEQKQADNLMAANRKVALGVQALNDARKKGDETSLARSKKLIEEAGSLYEGLEDTSQASNGIISVGKLLARVIEEEKQQALKKIAEEEKAEKEKAQKKITLANEVASKAIEAENKRHQEEMKNLDKEIAKIREKISLLNMKQNTVEQHVTKQGTEFRTDSSDSKYAKDISGDVKLVQQLDGVWVQATRKVGEYNATVGQGAKQTNDAIEAVGKLDVEMGKVGQTATATMNSVDGAYGKISMGPMTDSMVSGSNSAVQNLNAVGHVVQQIGQGLKNTTMSSSTALKGIADLTDSVATLFEAEASPDQKLDAAMKAYATLAQSGKIATEGLMGMENTVRRLAEEAGRPITLALDDKTFYLGVDNAGNKITQLYDTLQASPLQFDNNSVIMQFLAKIPGMVEATKKKIEDGKGIDIPVDVDDTKGAYESLIASIGALKGQIEEGETIDIPLSMASIEDQMYDLKNKILSSSTLSYEEAKQIWSEVTVAWDDFMREVEENPTQIGTEIDKRSYDKTVAALDKLAKDITVYIKPVVRSAGGAVGMSAGGRISGISSTRDTVDVKARKGEWFIRNESADYWDSLMPGMMSAINKPFSSVGRFIANTIKSQNVTTRNSVGVAQSSLTRNSNTDIMGSLQSFGTVNLTIGNQTAQVIADPMNARTLLKMIKTMGASAS